MAKLNAIIVDDEQAARSVLTKLIAINLPEVAVLDQCENITQAAKAIRDLKPDLVFLDIDMPGGSGFQLLDLLPERNIEIIFVTAYDQFAIKAFDVSALDYLLKPVKVERLRMAVNKLKVRASKDRNIRLNNLINTYSDKRIKKIVVPYRGGYTYINIANIIFLEASESYTNIITSDKKILVSKKLKHFEHLLEAEHAFVRPHRSFMINLNFVRHYSKSSNLITLQGDHVVKISKYKKTYFETAFRKFQSVL